MAFTTRPVFVNHKPVSAVLSGKLEWLGEADLPVCEYSVPVDSPEDFALAEAQSGGGRTVQINGGPKLRILRRRNDGANAVYELG